jgi:hypothetical protein
MEGLPRMSGEERNYLPPDEALTGLANFWFKMVVAGFVSFLAGVSVLIRTMVESGAVGTSAYLYLGLSTAVSRLFMAWLNGIKQRAPRRIQEFLSRMGLYNKAPRE